MIIYRTPVQKAQIQAESQLLLNMKTEHFYNLKWQQESEDAIF